MKRKWFVAATLSLFLMPVVAIGVLTSWDRFKITELPVLSKIPEFKLKDRSGRSLALSDLTGKVWIGSFIFTHCDGVCPMIAQRLQRIQRDLRLRTEVRYVSFTVDPERDSEAVLDSYAKRYDADPLRWFFLTGSKKEIENVVRKGFKLVLEEGTPETEPIMHSYKLALVDPWGRVRGYYDANEDAEMKKLLKDTRRLIKQAF